MSKDNGNQRRPRAISATIPENDPSTFALHDWLRRVVALPDDADMTALSVEWRTGGQSGPFVAVSWMEGGE